MRKKANTPEPGTRVSYIHDQNDQTSHQPHFNRYTKEKTQTNTPRYNVCEMAAANPPRKLTPML